jgi:uncharacterized membrane protein
VSRSIAVAVLAAVGAAVASYLALVQVGAVGQPWDPLFGAGSTHRVLDSAFSRALPVPDAALGAVAYLAEALIALAGLVPALRRSRALAALYLLVTLALLGTAIVLVAVQALVVRSFCSLCLVSAGLSVAAAALAIPEALERWRAAAEDGSTAISSNPRTTRRSVP